MVDISAVVDKHDFTDSLMANEDTLLLYPLSLAIYELNRIDTTGCLDHADLYSVLISCRSLHSA